MIKTASIVSACELLLSGVIAFFGNANQFGYSFLTLFGLINLIIGLLGFLIALVIVIFDRETAKPVFLSSGIVLLLGGLTCTFFPWNYN